MTLETTLVRSPGTSLHRQIFLVLRDRIVQGVYAPGEALPKEEALVEQFGVARVTVRRALADLELEGLVLRRHGRGTFVRSDARGALKVPTLGYLEELKHTAQTTRVEVLTVETTPPPPWIGEVLQIAPGERAVHAVRLRSAGTTPLMLTDAWVPETLGAPITASALKKQALYEILMDQGVEFGRVLQQISAEAADPSKATLLKCEVSSPLIRLTRLLHDRAGKPVQHLTVHLTPQRSSILMDISGEAINTLSGGHIVHDAQSLRSVLAARGKT
jgi:GntR family transcriptional regulator